MLKRWKTPKNLKKSMSIFLSRDQCLSLENICHSFLMLFKGKCHGSVNINASVYPPYRTLNFLKYIKQVSCMQNWAKFFFACLSCRYAFGSSSFLPNGYTHITWCHQNVTQTIIYLYKTPIIAKIIIWFLTCWNIWTTLCHNVKIDKISSVTCLSFLTKLILFHYLYDSKVSSWREPFTKMFPIWLLSKHKTT